ncbi:putative Amastin surface glycoprotein [Leishmania shawi]|uniref:Amastin surface glycoprotein n=1 Tax=Leishmania shawi TaxID=5680 RepID=A0AAW3C5W0_9TRYP
MAWGIALLVYVAMQFVAFFCVLVATPIDMFRSRNRTGQFPMECFTLWGYKQDCYSTAYDLPTDLLWRLCPARRNRFRVAEGFAVISVFVYCAAFVLGVIMLFCYRWLRWVCLALNSVGAVTVCIVWASMAVTYHKNEGPGCLAWRTMYTYGAGFVFLLLAWLLDLFNIPVLLLLPQNTDSAESGKETENKAQE